MDFLMTSEIEESRTKHKYRLSVLEQALETAESWDFSLVEKYLKHRRDMSPERIALVRKDYVRYMALIASGVQGFVCHAVDEFWHVHILHTQDYMKFCLALTGKSFIHHVPAATEEERNALGKNYLAFIGKYREHFGEPNREVWGPTDMVCRSDCGSFIEELPSWQRDGHAEAVRRTV